MNTLPSIACRFWLVNPAYFVAALFYAGPAMLFPAYMARLWLGAADFAVRYIVWSGCAAYARLAV